MKFEFKFIETKQQLNELNIPSNEFNAATKHIVNRFGSFITALITQKFKKIFNQFKIFRK